jgi:hypothetical protein
MLTISLALFAAAALRFVLASLLLAYCKCTSICYSASFACASPTSQALDESTMNTACAGGAAAKQAHNLNTRLSACMAKDCPSRLNLHALSAPGNTGLS